MKEQVVKLTLSKDKGVNLNEIFQQTKVLFSFVVEEGDGFRQLIPQVKCRDFLGDVIWSRVKEKRATIWGLDYEYAKDPYDTNRLMLSLNFPDDESYGRFVGQGLAYVHAKEEEAGIQNKTQILFTDKPLTLIVVADAIWQEVVWKLSLYTFFLKCASLVNPDKPSIGSTEYDYREVVTPKLEAKFLSKVTKHFNEFADFLQESHNYSGFVTIARSIGYDGWYPKVTKFYAEALLSEPKEKKATT